MIDLIIMASETAVHAADESAHAVAFVWADIWAGLRMGIAVIFVVSGLFFVLAGTLGVLRLPDFYTRMHAAGMTDTLGAELILLGLIVQSGFTQTSAKLLLVAFFLFLTSPTATHAVANAAYQAGLKPLTGRYRAPNPADISSDSETQDAH